MWSDSETNIDFLNYSEVSEMIAELIGDRQLLPLSLGVFGSWGTGKSTILRLVESELAKNSQEYLIVNFDAWLYQDFDDARAALMGAISSAIVENAPENLKKKATELLERVDKIRTLGLLLEGAALMSGFPAFGMISKGIDGIGASFKKQQVTNSKLINSKEGEGPTKQIDLFRSEFGALLEDLNMTLVVFIDNIDRCLPTNAIHTLEATRLFLFMPRTAFVVAADEDMIRHAVAHHFHNPSQKHIADYLDKLIQIPVRIPRVGVQEIRAYLFLLLCSRLTDSYGELEELRAFLIEKLRSSWKKEVNFSVADVLEIINPIKDEEIGPVLQMADRIAPALALSTSVLGNPRTVKRMLNVVRMRASVAKRRSIPLDEAMIAKFALFERCTDNDATKELHSLINAAEDGKPEILKQLEKLKNDGAHPTLPVVWKKHSSFLLDWAKLPPALGEVDLRPAVYLARETIPLNILSVQASVAAAHAIDVLLQVRTLGSPTAKAALDNLRSEEFVVVMDALISQMRKNSHWSKPRSDFRGAVMTAERSADAASELCRFVRSLQLPKMPGWMSMMLKNKSWWQQ